MAISPIASTIYANQVAPAASSVQSDLQAKFDLQNSLGAAAINNEEKRVQETRPAEETYKLDPKNEHERGAKGEDKGKKGKDKSQNNGEESAPLNEFTSADFGKDESKSKLNIIV